MKKELTQKEKVLKIVARAGFRGIITPKVMEKGLAMYVGNADRRLRELQEDGRIEGYKQEDSRVKTWFAVV